MLALEYQLRPHSPCHYRVGLGDRFPVPEGELWDVVWSNSQDMAGRGWIERDDYDGLCRVYGSPGVEFAYRGKCCERADVRRISQLEQSYGCNGKPARYFTVGNPLLLQLCHDMWWL